MSGCMRDLVKVVARAQIPARLSDRLLPDRDVFAIEFAFTI